MGEPTQHPELSAALAAFDDGDAGPIVGISLRARSAAGEGRYCSCREPLVAGLDLMCGACLLNNQDQERRKLLASYGAHRFIPAPSPAHRRMGWCACTYPADNERHHGVDKPCTTSWGERLEPPYDDLRRALTIEEVHTDG